MRNRAPKLLRRSWQLCISQSGSRRSYQIQAAPSTTTPADLTSTNPTSPDAQFEVLGSSSSLLSVNLTASQRLFTRRGTLVAVSGDPENATSSLSLLSPLIRPFLGIPFLYQQIRSTTPLNLLIGSKSPNNTFTVLNLDGRVDWKIAQRKGLLAWTGHDLAVEPTLDLKMSLAHWGKTTLAGRGLAALVGEGQIHQIKLVNGEEYVAHPSNVIAYTINRNPPQPYRFKSTSMRLQVPNLSNWLPKTKFFRTMQDTDTFKTFANILFHLRTWTRRTIWGDRLFLRFHGPATLLLQSRGSLLRDVLGRQEINEIADSPAGAAQSAITLNLEQGRNIESNERPGQPQQPNKTTMQYAEVGKDGKVQFRRP